MNGTLPKGSHLFDQPEGLVYIAPFSAINRAYLAGPKAAQFYAVTSYGYDRDHIIKVLKRVKHLSDRPAPWAGLTLEAVVASVEEGLKRPICPTLWEHLEC